MNTHHLVLIIIVAWISSIATPMYANGGGAIVKRVMKSTSSAAPYSKAKYHKAFTNEADSSLAAVGATGALALGLGAVLSDNVSNNSLNRWSRKNKKSKRQDKNMLYGYPYSIYNFGGR